MSVENFLDSNILIYHLETHDPRKNEIAGRIIRKGLETGNCCISYQVVQECLNFGLGKATVRMDAGEAERYLTNVLAPLFRVPASMPLYEKALGLKSRYGYSFYDSLIIAAALEAGCKRLYSEDLHHGQRIEGLTIENPFAV